jgi:hypothetical protein
MDTLPLTIELVDSPIFRLSLQLTTVLMLALAVHLVWREYRRFRSTFLRYIAMSLTLFLLQGLFLLAVFAMSAARDVGLPEGVMPMVDHALKVAATVYFVYAFVATYPSQRRLRRYFLWVNLALMAIAIPLIWPAWLRYLDFAPPDAAKFAFFWGDFLCEGWLTLLLLYGLYNLRRSRVTMRSAFVAAFVIFLLKELLHLGNIVLAHNTVPLVVLVERALLIPYSYLLVVAIHRQIIDEIDWVNRAEEEARSQIYESTIQALTGALELKDPYTQGHALRVTRYAMEIGTRLGLGETELRTLYLGAMLHDIGKIGVHEGILRKGGSLVEEEHRVLREHPEAGARAIGKVEPLRHLQETIRSHHERWDGAGYPQQLHGTEIPLHARIVAVADAYDAMTSNRNYRLPGSDSSAAIAELERCRSSQFDPAVVDAFLLYLRQTPSPDPAAINPSPFAATPCESH